MPPSLRKKRPRASAAASTPAAGKSTRKKPRQSSVVGAGPPADSETDRLTEEEQQPAQEALQPAQLAFSDGAGGGDDQESEDEECGEAGWVPGPPWRPLNVPPSELRLASTLMSGQSFRWERRLVSHATSAGSSWRAQYPGDLAELGAHAELDHTARHVEYVGPIDRHLFVLRETPTDVFFRIASEGSAPDEARDCLRKYLRLLPAAGAPLDPQALWRGDLDIQSSAVDPGLAERLQRFPGVRLLALPLLESVFCFMGSANNNIKRNSQMIASMCAEFPQNLLGNIGGTDFFAFPSLAEMATLDEARLSELGWGYRAPRFVKMCPELLSRGGVAWLEDLRGRGREVARERLCELTGVGRKVADCITLFSLCQDDCIPVDTHAWQFMQRSGYLPQLKKASGLTDKSYALIGETLRKRYGERGAGWAFIVLFVAEVHPFRVAMERECVFNEKLWFGGKSDATRMAKMLRAGGEGKK